MSGFDQLHEILAHLLKPHDATTLVPFIFFRHGTNLLEEKSEPYYRALPFWSAAVRPLPAGPRPLLSFPLQ